MAGPSGLPGLGVPQWAEQDPEMLLPDHPQGAWGQRAQNLRAWTSGWGFFLACVYGATTVYKVSAGQ